MPKNNKEISIILHNIRSLHNVGAIFRTADAAGVSKIYLTGYTPAPFDKLGKLEQNFAKSALGAEKFIEYEKTKNIGPLLNRFKKNRVQVVALEQNENSTIYSKFKPKWPIAIIFGNEVEGISKDILKKCDEVIEIPMRGQKESLNVSVAAGVALFGIIC